MAVATLALYQASTDLLNCVCTALGELVTEMPGLEGCPCRSCVVPGSDVALDGCDSPCGTPMGQYGGQLAVNVVRLFSSTPQGFPREVAVVRDASPCATPVVTAAELRITLARCSPLPSDDGCPPTCDELSAAAMQQHADMVAVRRGVDCCYAATSQPGQHKGRRYVLGASRTVGPAGGCHSFEQTVTVLLDQ